MQRQQQRQRQLTNCCFSIRKGQLSGCLFLYLCDMFDVTLISDTTVDGIRRASFLTCGIVCSEQIDIELEGDTIRDIRYTKGCHGNTQGVAALCKGMKAEEVIARLDGIDCHGRGTSCPDQLARALKALR